MFLTRCLCTRARSDFRTTTSGIEANTSASEAGSAASHAADRPARPNHGCWIRTGAGALVATGDDTGFSALPDGTTLVYVDAGALRKIQLSGTWGLTLVGSGVVAVDDISQQSIVYATFQDAATGLETPRIVRTSGSGDSAIGTTAASEHYTPGETIVAARTNIVGRG